MNRCCRNDEHDSDEPVRNIIDELSESIRRNDDHVL